MTITEDLPTPFAGDAAIDAHADRRLVAGVAARLTIPREAPADSFVLHAPLELTARSALLPFVGPESRTMARRRLLALADAFEASGPAATVAARPTVDADAFSSVDEAAARLVEVIDRGELDDVDAVAHWLGRAASSEQLRAVLTAGVTDRLAAAAHAPIFLYHLPRVAPRGEVPGELVRGLARELARYPDWRLHWIDGLRESDSPGSADDVFAAIAATPRPTGPPDSTFIFPTMAFVDGNGMAAGQLGPVVGGDDVAARGRAVLRAAAWSMLLEPDDHAAYGWSHALTMPQAVLGTAAASGDPSRALAIAATYVVGFRATIGARPLDPVFPHDDPHLALPEAIAAGPDVAAAAAWHGAASPPEVGAIAQELASRASAQRDAHLVKYVLACFDAAADDPAHRRLFLAAAASLVAWWHGRPDPEDPLA